MYSLNFLFCLKGYGFRTQKSIVATFAYFWEWFYDIIITTTPMKMVKIWNFGSDGDRDL